MSMAWTEVVYDDITLNQIKIEDEHSQAMKSHSKHLDPHLSEVHGPPLPEPVSGLRSLFAQTAVEYSQALALVCMHQANDIVPIHFPTKYSLREEDAISSTTCLRWSHGQLQYAAQVLADGFRARGVHRGQPIATYLHNGVEWAIAIRAATILRCPFVPLNPRGVANATEVEHMLRTSGAKAIIASDASIASKLSLAAPRLIASMTVRAVCEKDPSVVPELWSSFDNFFSPGNEAGISTPPYDHPGDSALETEEKDVALIVFTSGTTSLPKGAIHTNTSVATVLLSQAIGLQLTSSHRTCCHMPTHHIGGIAIALGFMIVGASTVFPSAAFDPAASLQAISLERCTNMPCVPVMLQAIAAQPQLASTDTSSLRNIEMGATTILLEHLRLCWSALRCPMMTNAYGATEALPVSLKAFNTQTADSINVGTVTKRCRLRICAPDSCVPLPRGEAGELHIGGPQLIQGYLGGSSAKSFYEDESGVWFISGDQGIMLEDGSITISGRYKDLIIRGGENIAPAAIEAVLDNKLKINAQVVGIKSEEAGEVPVAVIQQKDGDLPVTEMRKVLVDALGPAFVPEYFYTLQDLGLEDYPRTSSGKVRKVDLKDILQQHEDSLLRQTATASASNVSVSSLIDLWKKLIGVNLQPESSVHDFADSITLMRFRNMVKRTLGVDITTEEIMEAGTVQRQAELLLSRGNTPTVPLGLETTRAGPPAVDDVAITLGEPEVMAQIRDQVIEAISPLGFTWDEDVQDILPSWDLGYEVFGNVAGTAKVNHRMAVSTKQASVEDLHTALCIAIEHHAMQRSFELKGPRGEPTMRVIMRANHKWLKYAIGDILEVDHPEDLVKLLYDGVHFAEVEAPYPSFLVKVAKIKSTGRAGLIWALQHSAFDGLALSTFLEDLDTLLASPSTPLRAHVPYKAWADMYYLHRSSHAATRSVTRQVRRLEELSSHTSSLFPALPLDYSPLTGAEHRKTFIAPKFSTALPHLSTLRSSHNIPPFILVKAALAVFLARKSQTQAAIFSQNENGRSWPFVEPWMQPSLPDCMDLAGPTLERTVQIVRMPEASATVMQYLEALKTKQDEEAQDVHAPWNLVREGLAKVAGSEHAKQMFDAAAMSTCLNYLPIRTKDGELLYDAMEYHETKANCETAWLFNCWIEGEGADTKLWTQILSDEDIVDPDTTVEWAREVMAIASWLARKENWEKGLGELQVDPEVAKIK